MAKCIKHAFTSYPKLKIGRGTILESEIPEQRQPVAEFDPYNVDNTATAPQQQEQHFAPAPDMSAGVTIDPAQGAENKCDDTF